MAAGTPAPAPSGGGSGGGAQAGSIFLRLQLGNANQFRQSVANTAQGAGSHAGGMFSKLFNAAVIAAIPIGIVAAIKKVMTSSAVELASDLQETQNVVNKSFGSMKQSAEDFAKSAMASYGITELQAKQYSSTYMSMAAAMGLSEETAAKMSINLTKLSADVASFYNLSNDEAYNKFKGVFSGETEPLKALGIVMTQTNLEAFALKEGITTSYQAMSEAEKVALRYKFIMNQLALAQGDFASTADGWANSMKTLQNQFDAFKTKVGNGLIKIFTPLLQVLNACVEKLGELMDVLYEKLGWDFGEEEAAISMDTITTSAEESASSVSDAYEKAAKDSKKALEGIASFDQINKLTGGSSAEAEDSGSDYKDGGGEFSFNPFGDEYTVETEKAVNPMAAVVDKALGKLKELWDTYGTKVVGVIKSVYDFFKPYGDRLVEIIKKLKATFDEWWAINGEEFSKNLKIVWGIIVDIVSYLLDNLFDWLEEWGPRILEGLLNFINDIVDFLADYGPVIEETLKAIIDAFFIIFDVVGFIIAALLNEGIPAIRLVLETIAQVVLVVSSVVMGLIFTILDCIGWIFKSVVELGVGIWNVVDATVTFIIDMAIGLWHAIEEGIIGAIDFFVYFFESIGEKISSTIEAVKGFFSDLWNSITEFFSSIWGSITGFFANVWSSITGFFADAKNAVRDAFDTVKGFFADLWDSITGFFSDARNAVVDFWNGFLEAAKAPINGIIGLINKMIDGLNSIQFDIPEWLGGGKFGINIAHIPMLAEGGIVTAPTLAMVGEGAQNEAVVPLDDFKRDIASIVATSVATVMSEFAMAKNESGEAQGNIELTVNVGGDKLYNNVIKEINRRTRNNGKCVINT